MRFKLSDRFLITCKISAKVYQVKKKNDKTVKILWKPKFDIDIDSSIFEETETEDWVSIENNIKFCSYFCDNVDELNFDKNNSTLTLIHQFSCHRYDIHKLFDMECHFALDEDFKYWLKSYMEQHDDQKLCDYGDKVKLKVKTFEIDFDIQIHPDLKSYYKIMKRKDFEEWDREIAAERIQKYYRIYRNKK